MRDFQRARVYRAEDYLDESTFLKFSNIRECREYAESIWSNPAIRARFPKACSTEKPPIKQAKTSSQSSQAYWPPHEKVTLSKHGQNDYVVIHELAHIITEREYAKGEDWIKHGPLWADVHLFLVKTMLGRDFYLNVVEAFEMEGVQYTRNK